MKTPIERAKELFKKSLPLAHDWEADNVIVAKKIAILCVDEILALDNDDVYLRYGYWREVKSEIEKL